MMLHKIQNKIKSQTDLILQVKHWKATNQKVVFTNGCFDLLHYGHVYYLAQAKELGDKLIVAINSDESIRKLKGNHRPINTVETRTFLLASMEMIDALIVFEDDTPIPLLKLLEPQILVKGGDRKTLDEIVGADVVLDYGGTVKSLAFKPGYSTTQIEEKIKNSN